MIKVQVRQEDVQVAKRFLLKQPGTSIEIHDPVAQALKRMLAKDPRWRRPQVSKETINFIPRAKYPSLKSISIPLPKKVQKYCHSFDEWCASGFKGNGIGTIDFTLKGVFLVDGRLHVG
jgi:hypothetical protein